MAISPRVRFLHALTCVCVFVSSYTYGQVRSLFSAVWPGFCVRGVVLFCGVFGETSAQNVCDSGRTTCVGRYDSMWSSVTVADAFIYRAVAAAAPWSAPPGRDLNLVRIASPFGTVSRDPSVRPPARRRKPSVALTGPPRSRANYVTALTRAYVSLIARSD